MKLFIKYMVSLRCKLTVKAELDKLGLNHGILKLGSVDVQDGISIKQYAQLKNALLQSGLELMEDKKAILSEQIKNAIIEMVHYEEEITHLKHSVYLSKKLNHSYAYLANVFSSVTGTTIAHFIIAHKIERAKELLVYNDLNLTQISYKLNYSSVAHLSNQFKEITGFTPSSFKKLKDKKLTTLENV